MAVPVARQTTTMFWFVFIRMRHRGQSLLITIDLLSSVIIHVSSAVRHIVLSAVEHLCVMSSTENNSLSITLT